MAASITPVDLPVLPSRLPTGHGVGRYVVDGWVRDGGMSVMYRGHHVELGTKVAIKVIAEQWAGDAVMIARFRREGQLMGRLANVSGVVRVHDVGQLSDGRRYLVMEWIEGEDLEDALDHVRNQDAKIEVARACRIVRDVARGIAGAHARQVVHRDLKPANVMLDHREGVERAKVVDFGVSADLGAHERGEDLTNTGLVLGTSGYMAPEQAFGLRADPAFDVWALGAILFELLTGMRVPAGVEARALPDVRERRRELAEPLARLVRACLNRDPELRPTASEVASRLDAILGQLAIADLGDAPDDDRPDDAAGAIDGTDPLQPLVRRGDASGLGLAPPPRLTPVRLAARVLPAGVEPVARRPPPARGRARLVIAVVGLFAIAGAIALWMRGDDEEAAPLRDSERKAEPAPAPAKAHDAAKAPTIERKADAKAEVEPDVQPDAEVLPEPEPPVVDEKVSPTEAKVSPPKHNGKSAPKSAAEPTGPAHATQRCAAQRDAAEAAKASRNWTAVLAKTRDASCWPSASDRTLLRVTALAELKRYDECVRTGAGHADPKIASRTRWCRSQQEAG